VKAIYAQANEPVKKSDLLLEIEPAPYQYAVNQIEAQLNASKANVNQAEASLEAAKANLAKANAADSLAKTQERIALNIQRKDVAAISQLKVTEARQQRLEADAAVQQAEAATRQAAFAVQLAQSNVPAIEAQLDDARFNLAQCKMLAPTDGYVVNWQVQIGTMLVPAPIAAAGTFVNTADIAVAAVFPQNWLTNVRPGDDVEMVLNPYPGRLFFGKMDFVISATGGGQFTTSGTIPNAAKIGSDGLYAVRISFSDEGVARNLSIGSGGSAVIYTKAGKPTHIISKVAIRMKKWLLYVMPSVEKSPS